MAYTSDQWGIRAPAIRYARRTDNTTVNSVADNKPVLINSRDYVQQSGTSIGFQCKPNQATGNTAVSVHGCEIQPRFADGQAGKDLVGTNISAILKGTTGDLSGEVHVLEVETDFNGGASPTRTITGDCSMLRINADWPSAMTFSGKKIAIKFPALNDGKYDLLFDFDTSQVGGFMNATASLGSQIGQILIRVGSTTRCIPYYATS